MPPKKQQSVQVNEDSSSSRKYNLRQNKKGKQASKNNARDKKSYTEDTMDLPEGTYDDANASKLPDGITKETFKKNIIVEHSPSNSPPISDDEIEEVDAPEEEEEEFDESYFDPVPYEDPKK
jgi:hypothetical protein